MVQSCGLGTRMLASDLAVDLEPETRTGPSPQARAPAHDRVCACSSTTSTTRSSCLWLCPSRSGFSMEGWSLLRPRFHPPTRRDPPVSSKPGASCPGTASRSRWQPACGVCGQQPQLSSLPPARTVSMAGACHEEAAPGQREARIRLPLVPHRSSGEMGAAESTGVPVSGSCGTNASK